MSPQLLSIRRERAWLLGEELAKESGIPVTDIFGKTRDPQVVAVRHRLWAILHDSGLSMNAIGMVVGRDHTTVRSALAKRRVAEVADVPVSEMRRTA